MNKIQAITTIIKDKSNWICTISSNCTTCVVVFLTYQSIFKWLLLLSSIILIVTIIFHRRRSIKIKKIEKDKQIAKSQKNKKINELKSNSYIFKFLYSFFIIMGLISLLGYLSYSEEIKNIEKQKVKQKALLDNQFIEYNKIVQQHKGCLDVLPEYENKAINENDPHSQTAIGYLYLTGFNNKISPNYALAKKYLLMAANSDVEINYYANIMLAKMATEGIEEIQDDRKFIDYCLLVADAGLADAQYSIGGAYFYGRGIKQDINKAKKYLILAAEQGHIEAQKLLGYLYQLNNVEDESLKWFKEASLRGDAPSTSLIGTYYYNKGKYNECIKYLEKALLKDSTEVMALAYIGLCYQNGFGFEKNEKIAEKYFIKGVEQKNSNVIVFLTELYCSQGNYEKAMESYLKAESEGYSDENLKHKIKMMR